MNRIIIGWNVCKFSNYIQVTRCFKCNAFGHIAKDCKQANDSCGYCGVDHKTKDCNHSQRQPFCTNCEKFNKTNKSQVKLNTNHSSFSDECESLKRIKRIICERTDDEF